mmetsp:Transcript_16435/g.27870  ORF Transcript_16435/g.27870 Transcript_16435/m.27870 type:complete len:92 (+) Transcript_16435:10-285(+)
MEAHESNPFFQALPASTPTLRIRSLSDLHPSAGSAISNFIILLNQEVLNIKILLRLIAQFKRQEGGKETEDFVIICTDGAANQVKSFNETI